MEYGSTTPYLGMAQEKSVISNKPCAKCVEMSAIFVVGKFYELHLYYSGVFIIKKSDTILSNC